MSFAKLPWTNGLVLAVAMTLAKFALVNMVLTNIALTNKANGQTYRSFRPHIRPATGPVVRPAARLARGAAVRPAAYRLGPGDMVAVVVFGVTGDYTKAPVHFPSDGDGTLPATGYPMIVQPDGTLAMPLLEPVSVGGLTVTQARNKIAQTYVDQKILKLDRQVTLSLLRKRTVSVSVLHDNPGAGMRSGAHVQVPADRPRVLEALIASGPFDRDGRVRIIKSNGLSVAPNHRLDDGDIVQVQSPRRARFYTGGDLRGGVYELPTDRRINALQAISIAGGVSANRSLIGPTHVTIIHQGGGATRIKYRQLLQNPNAWIMRPDDTLVVR